MMHPPLNSWCQLPTNVYSKQLPLTSAICYTDTSGTKNTGDITSGPGPTSTSCLTKTTTIWYPLNSARTFRRPSFQRTQLGVANHSAYSTRRDQIQRLHISATFISANTTLRFQTPGLLKSLNL